jgi:hypothetical protein
VESAAVAATSSFGVARTNENNSPVKDSCAKATNTVYMARELFGTKGCLLGHFSVTFMKGSNTGHRQLQ